MADKEGLDGSHLVLNGTPKTVAIDAVKQHPDNYRKGDVTTIVESVENNKFYGRLIVQKSTGFILAGNHRWLAALKLGIKEIPIEEIDVDDETARRILLVDNRSSDKAENDEAKVIELLQAIVQKDDELTGTGWTGDELGDLIAKSENAPPDKKKRAPRPPSGKDGYSEQYAVIVLCSDEDQQERTYEALREEGYTLKAVST